VFSVRTLKGFKYISLLTRFQILLGHNVPAKISVFTHVKRVAELWDCGVGICAGYFKRAPVDSCGNVIFTCTYLQLSQFLSETLVVALLVGFYLLDQGFQLLALFPVS
jgi:hypothetical protein